MVLERIIDPIFLFLTKALGLMPQIPEVPESLSNVVDDFLALLFENGGLVGFFIPMEVVKIALPIALIIINFERIYNLVMWLLKKIPILGLD